MHERLMIWVLGLLELAVVLKLSILELFQRNFSSIGYKNILLVFIYLLFVFFNEKSIQKFESVILIIISFSPPGKEKMCHSVSLNMSLGELG